MGKAQGVLLGAKVPGIFHLDPIHNNGIRAALALEGQGVCTFQKIHKRNCGLMECNTAPGVGPQKSAIEGDIHLMVRVKGPA